jgi:hypothetical protein
MSGVLKAFDLNNFKNGIKLQKWLMLRYKLVEIERVFMYFFFVLEMLISILYYFLQFIFYLLFLFLRSLINFIIVIIYEIYLIIFKRK